MIVTPDTLTAEQVRDHLAWLHEGQYKLGEGPRAGLDKREAIRDCLAAISWLTSTGPWVAAPQRMDKSATLARVCAAINLRASGGAW